VNKSNKRRQKKN